MPSAISAEQTARIPAWKRLGLKLKSAQDTTLSEPPKDLDTHKRKKTDASEDTSPPKKVKKQRLEATSTTDSVTPTLVRKKSVTFTPETKVEDGDSIKQLFNSWVTEQLSQDPSFDLKTSTPVFNTPEPPRIEEQIDPSLPEKERRVKRVKSQKGNKSSQSKDTALPQQSKSAKPSKIVKPSTSNSRPFLSYLRQYSEDKPNWKFNKNHQNHIIKNIFDINVIPSDHANFIYEYVKGLQGGVRMRLRDAALSINLKNMEEDDSNYVGDDARKAREFEAAEKEYVASQVLVDAPREIGYEEGVILGLSDSAMKERMATRVRAEAILRELAANGGTGITETVEEDDEESQKRAKMVDGLTQKRARPRKQRTMAEDVETSSSEDSSDSSSSPTPPHKAQKIHYNQSEDTSSSSSSTGSSGTEEDSSDEDSSEEDSSDEDSNESESD